MRERWRTKEVVKGKNPLFDFMSNLQGGMEIFVLSNKKNNCHLIDKSGESVIVLSGWFWQQVQNVPSLANR